MTPQANPNINPYQYGFGDDESFGITISVPDCIRQKKSLNGHVQLFLIEGKPVHSGTGTTSIPGQDSDAGDLRRTYLLIHPLNELRLYLQSMEQYLQYRSASFHLQ